MKVDFYRPVLPDFKEMDLDFWKVINSGILAYGDYTDHMEKMFADYLQVKYVCSVSSCSDGLICVLNCIPPKSKVVMPAFSFKGVHQACQWHGHTAVLCDVDEDGHMDYASLFQILKNDPTITAVFNVPLFGNVKKDLEIKEICRNTNTKLFYDHAHGMAARFDGRPVGEMGDAAVFSISSTKSLPCGEGGLLATNDESIYIQFKHTKIHGNETARTHARTKGINGKCTEFTGVLAKHGLPIMERNRQARDEIAKCYQDSLRGYPIRFQKTAEGCDSGRCFLGSWVENGHVRDSLCQFLLSKDIEVRQYFPNLAEDPTFEGIAGELPVSKKLAATCINIPFHGRLTQEEINFVIDSVKEFFDVHRENVLHA